jgi:hypothetical protein
MSTKEKAKAFMYVCIGIAALTLGLQQIASPALGQQGGGFVSVSTTGGTGGVYVFALTETGDCYMRTGASTWVFDANVIESAGVIPAQSESWGGVKAKSR